MHHTANSVDLVSRHSVVLGTYSPLLMVRTFPNRLTIHKHVINCDHHIRTYASTIMDRRCSINSIKYLPHRASVSLCHTTSVPMLRMRITHALAQCCYLQAMFCRKDKIHAQRFTTADVPLYVLKWELCISVLHPTNVTFFTNVTSSFRCFAN